MAGGGKRPGAGRPRDKLAGQFRIWCRGLFFNREVLAAVKERAKIDPEFALRVAEHGFGRPPQSVNVSGHLVHEKREFVAVFADGDVAATAALPVSTGAPN